MIFSRSLREKAILVLFFYWITILVVRAVIFLSFRDDGKGPEIFINNFHLHHFFIGSFLILIFLISYLLEKKGLLFLLSIGIGLALFFDELDFINGSHEYWTFNNFLSILGGGIFLLFIIFLTDRGNKRGMIDRENQREPIQKVFISVVIPALNEGNFLAKTLESLRSQNYKNFETIVVDNGSNDNTVEIAESFGSRVIAEKRKGVGFARQAGFSAAKGEIIASTDADTILPEDWLSRIAVEFEKDKNLAAFGGLYVLSSGPIMARLAFSFFSYPAWCFDRFFLGGWSLAGANFAVRRDCFLKIGGFNAELRFGEDADLSHRLRAVGEVKLDPDFLVQTSGRRWRNGLLAGLLSYVPSNLERLFFKKNIFNNLSAVRVEKSPLRKLSFLPFIASLLMLFLFFYSSNPSISQAKNIIAVKNKLTTAKDQISVKEKTIRTVLVKNIKKIDLSSTIMNPAKWDSQRR